MNKYKQLKTNKMDNLTLMKMFLVMGDTTQQTLKEKLHIKNVLYLQPKV